MAATEHAPARRPSAARFATIFGSAVVLGQLGQIVWLTTGSRTMSAAAFGTVLATQALYAFLQTVVDSGTALHGARLSAADELDAKAHGSVVRLRVQLALAGAAVAVGVGAVGGSRSLVAAAPFAAALVLFALMNYWTRFGLGDSRPWSAYIVLRAVAPAATASAFLIGGATFPVFLAGTIECAVIVSVALAFGLRPLTELLLALRARTVPWKSAIDIGLPLSLAQVSLASGAVLLNAAGTAAAAGTFAVGVRLVTGVNALSVIIVSALFPQLARRDDTEETVTADDRSIRVATHIIVVVGAVAMALLLAATPFFVELFLNHSSDAAQAATLVVLGSGVAAGFSLLLTMVLVARRLESVILRSYVASTGVTLAGGVAVIAADPGRPAVAMAVPLLAGQLLTAGILERRAETLLPALRRVMRQAAVATVAVAAVGVAGAAAPDARAGLAAGSLTVAALFVVLIVRERRAS